MHPLINALEQNKRAKGTLNSLVIEQIQALASADEILVQASEQGQFSALGAVIGHAPNEVQAELFAKTLLDRGADASDAHVPGTAHAKAINQAIRQSYYGVAFSLIEHGARPNDIVHQWLRRPRSVAEAKQQMRMEQLLWQHYDEPLKQEHHVAIMASLMACEVLTGTRTQERVREELSRRAMEEARRTGWDNHQYLLSNLNDACKVLKGHRKTESRVAGALLDWFDAIQGEHLDHTKWARSYPSIPESLWDRLPGLVAEHAARMIDTGTTAATTPRHRPVRL